MNNRPVVDSCSIQKCLERDPGAYISSPRFSTDEMKYLIELGPYEPHLSTYPRRATNNLAENDDVESTSKKSLSFQDRWYCDYPLIEYSILKDRAYCFACRLFGSGPGSLLADRAWTTNGVYQWKKMTGKYGKLNKHFKSTAHISAYQRLQTHCIIYCICLERVYVNHRQQELLKLNRYVISTLLDVTKVLTRQSLSFRAEIESEGNFNDGGLNMCGEYKGVKAMLSESVGREVIFVPCCAHRSNKIVEHASQNSLEAAKFFGLCEKLYVFLTG
ncbi:unnamed protein product, partial [Rotaria magnacalcarata]